MLKRPRRNRQSESVRSLVRETSLQPEDFILPLFIVEGKGIERPIPSMPRSFYYSLDKAIERAKFALSLNIRGLLLFPQVSPSLKDPRATQSYKSDGLLQRGIKALKDALPQMTLFSDVAMDPYSSDGHDGLLRNGKILNDESLKVLSQMALSQARAGVDFIAPSDMMDGRVKYLREALDQEGFFEVGILSYAAKYASNLYTPFREALGSKPKSLKAFTTSKSKSLKHKPLESSLLRSKSLQRISNEVQVRNQVQHQKTLSAKGDKKTYQMDFSNVREALREVQIDEEEGTDIIMVKPALFYLDVIRAIREKTQLPLAAYFVSGEENMIYAAGEKGFLSEEDVFMEALTGIKRSGADIIVSYGALKAAKILSS